MLPLWLVVDPAQLTLSEIHSVIYMWQLTPVEDGVEVPGGCDDTLRDGVHFHRMADL